jgi:hypothetical protein
LDEKRNNGYASVGEDRSAAPQLNRAVNACLRRDHGAMTYLYARFADAVLSDLTGRGVREDVAASSTKAVFTVSDFEAYARHDGDLGLWLVERAHARAVRAVRVRG